jgi:transposase
MIVPSAIREKFAMDEIVRIGMDTSKNVFQLHGVNAAEEPVLRRRFRRAQMMAFMSRIGPTVVGIEAGGATHYWARTFAAMGHEVRIMALARSLFRELGDELALVDERVRKLDAVLLARHRQNEVSQRLAQVPGIGTLGASMLALKTPDPDSFRSARHFAAWIGLTPRDHSSGGKNRLGTITRAGDETLRRVLVVGATAVIRQMRRGQKRRWPWLERLLERKPPKLVAIALANKLARIAWKLITSGQAYQPGHIMSAG